MVVGQIKMYDVYEVRMQITKDFAFELAIDAALEDWERSIENWRLGQTGV